MQTNNNLWQILPLREIASASSNSFVDGPFGSNLKSDEYTTEGVRLIQLQNIGDGEWIDDNKIFTSEKKYQELKRHAAFPGDIAVAKMADPIARACIIPAVSDRFLVVADCIKLSPDLKKYHSKFIVYAINNHNVRLQAELKSTGTTRKRINLSLLKTVKIEIPPLHEQLRIAEILNTIDKAIQKTEALISKLKAMKQGLLHDLLARGLDENGKLRDPKAHPEQFKDSPLGRIPKEWAIGGIDQFLSPTDGIKPGPFGSSITKRMYTAEGYKVYGQEQVIADDLTVGDYYISPNKYNELRIFEIHENDILVSLVGTVGCVLVVRRPFKPGIINPRLIRFRPVLSKGNPVFLKELLMSDTVKGQLASLFQGGTMPVLSATTMRKLILAKPKQNEQEMIAKVLVDHDACIRTEEGYRAKLKLQKKGLMHDLLTGKVRVKV